MGVPGHLSPPYGDEWDRLACPRWMARLDPNDLPTTCAVRLEAGVQREVPIVDEGLDSHPTKLDLSLGSAHSA